MSDTIYVKLDDSAVAYQISRLQTNINHVVEAVGSLSGHIQTMQNKLLSQMSFNTSRIDELKKEVSRSIEAAALAKVVEAATEIFAKIGILESSKKRIRQQYHKSLVRCGRISEKFDTFNTDVEGSYHKDIQRLGKYIFEIWNDYSEKVEERITKKHTGFLTTLSQSVEDIRLKREQKLETLLNDVTMQLELFLEQRKQFHNSIGNITVDKLDAPIGKIAIPMILIKMEGKSTTQIKIGNEVVGETGEHLYYGLKDTEFFNSYRSENSGIDMSMAWRDMTSAELMQLEGSIETLAGKKLISKEYCESLIQVLKKYPPKVPEQRGTVRESSQSSEIAGPPPEKTNPKEIHICLNDDDDINEINCSPPQSPIMVHPPEGGTGARKVEIQLDD